MLLCGLSVGLPTCRVLPLTRGRVHRLLGWLRCYRVFRARVRSGNLLSGSLLSRVGPRGTGGGVPGILPGYRFVSGRLLRRYLLSSGNVPITCILRGALPRRRHTGVGLPSCGVLRWSLPGSRVRHGNLLGYRVVPRTSPLRRSTVPPRALLSHRLRRGGRPNCRVPYRHLLPGVLLPACLRTYRILRGGLLGCRVMRGRLLSSGDLPAFPLLRRAWLRCARSGADPPSRSLLLHGVLLGGGARRGVL